SIFPAWGPSTGYSPPVASEKEAWHWLRTHHREVFDEHGNVRQDTRIELTVDPVWTPEPVKPGVPGVYFTSDQRPYALVYAIRVALEQGLWVHGINDELERGYIRVA